MNLYIYVRNNYKENEPIFIKDIAIEGVSAVNLRQQLMRLTEKNLLARYDTGIYFIPENSMFRSGSSISREKVIEQKYLRKGNEYIGYISGLLFANQAGITSQVPMVYEVATNMATKDYRETSMAGAKVIVRKPRSNVNKDNYKSLQLLDLLKDFDIVSEIPEDELKVKISRYMIKAGITFEKLEPFLKLYPNKIYGNLFKVGILNGISAQ